MVNERFFILHMNWTDIQINIPKLYSIVYIKSIHNMYQMNRKIKQQKKNRTNKKCSIMKIYRVHYRFIRYCKCYFLINLFFLLTQNQAEYQSRCCVFVRCEYGVESGTRFEFSDFIDQICFRDLSPNNVEPKMWATWENKWRRRKKSAFGRK